MPVVSVSRARMLWIRTRTASWMRLFLVARTTTRPFWFLLLARTMFDLIRRRRIFTTTWFLVWPSDGKWKYFELKISLMKRQMCRNLLLALVAHRTAANNEARSAAIKIQMKLEIKRLRRTRAESLLLNSQNKLVTAVKRAMTFLTK